MARISETLAWLDTLKPASVPTAPGRLAAFRPGVANPGAIEAFVHIPDGLPAGAPLVVALHGCTQTASGYDHGTGWSRLADRAGFAVLLPQQTRANNGNLCFNWFEPHDIARRGGEAESIAALTEAAIAAHGIDRTRVFVTGLSAGGAMTAVMLATYPDLFAGGAIFGGLPYGCAASVGEALARMRGQGHAPDAAATASVKRASESATPRWPTISLWHGTGDATVNAANMAAIGRQWRGVHELGATPTDVERGANWERARWQGADGRTLVEEWSIAGMGHGVPIDAAGGGGVAGPYMLDVGIDSTRAIAAVWGLVDAAPAGERSQGPRDTTPSVAMPRPAAGRAAGWTSGPAAGVQETIERALRSAGLMR